MQILKEKSNVVHRETEKKGKKREGGRKERGQGKIKQ